MNLIINKRNYMKNFLLSMMLCIPMMSVAQNGVTVSGLAINAGTVTFNVSWSLQAMQDLTPPLTLWSDSVWVFVDYNNAGRMTRLPLNAGATLTAISAGLGKVVQVPNNNKGVWVIGNARTNGSFSATVQLLTAEKEVAGACAYASNYPPVGDYTATDRIAFTGTAPYELVLLRNGGGTITQTVYSPYIPACDYTVQSFTDKTGAPGIVKCVPGAEGQAPHAACGCASGLSDCDGTCRVPCWLSCGITGISTVSYEGYTNWNSANGFCQNKGSGWRLPSREELLCMCSKKSSLPGGYVGGNYWSSSANGSTGEWYFYVDFSNGGNCASQTNLITTNYYVKCVKK
jgi:hypothetical protein